MSSTHTSSVAHWWRRPITASLYSLSNPQNAAQQLKPFHVIKCSLGVPLAFKLHVGPTFVANLALTRRGRRRRSLLGNHGRGQLDLGDGPKRYEKVVDMLLRDAGVEVGDVYPGVHCSYLWGLCVCVCVCIYMQGCCRIYQKYSGYVFAVQSIEWKE